VESRVRETVIRKSGPKETRVPFGMGGGVLESGGRVTKARRRGRGRGESHVQRQYNDDGGGGVGVKERGKEVGEGGSCVLVAACMYAYTRR
jgi:hypothetical protein